MCLFNPANPDIAAQHIAVIEQLMDTASPDYTKRVARAQATMSALVRANHARTVHPSAQAAQWPRDEQGRWLSGAGHRTVPAVDRIPVGPDDELVEIEVPAGEPCPHCDGHGRVTEVGRVFADGGWLPRYHDARCAACDGLGYVPYDAWDDGPQAEPESRYTRPSRLLAP